eukprot:COSAG01_NODE_69479_length_261_cov_0.641975_1_plen_48_part_01
MAAHRAQASEVDSFAHDDRVGVGMGMRHWLHSNEPSANFLETATQYCY